MSELKKIRANLAKQKQHSIDTHIDTADINMGELFLSEYMILKDHPEHDVIGRGTHYTTYISPETRHIVTIIWDEDDDPRIFEICDNLIKEGVFTQVQILGERKGNVTLISNTNQPVELNQWTQADFQTAGGDVFSVGTTLYDAPTMIIDATPGEIIDYFNNQSLWADYYVNRWVDECVDPVKRARMKELVAIILGKIKEK